MTTITILISLVLVEAGAVIALMLLIKSGRSYFSNQKKDSSQPINKEGFTVVWLELVLFFVVMALITLSVSMNYSIFFSIITSITITVGTIINLKKIFKIRHSVKIATNFVPKKHHIYHSQILVLLLAVLGFNASAISLTFGLWLLSISK
jgi:hypothetical protein